MRGCFRGETARYGCLLLAALVAAVSGPIIAKALTERRNRQALEAAGMHVGTKPQYGGLVQVVGEVLAHDDVTIDDADARLIAGCNNVEMIYVQDSILTDESLDRFGRLPSLKALVLWTGRLTDDGIRRFRPGDGDSLSLVVLSQPDLSDDALAELVANNSNLASIDFGGTKAGPQTLAAVSQSRRLAWIRLHDTPVTNDDFRNLSEHESVMYISLDGTRLASPLPFDPQRFPALRRLYLKGTAVTREEADGWEASLPGLRVFVGER
jgi:hypothetical protein